MFTIEVQNAHGDVLARAEGQGDARLIYTGTYRIGDVIVFTTQDEHASVWVDQAVAQAGVYLPQKQLTFHIPFGDATGGYAPQAFSGDRHAIWVGPLGQDAKRCRRVISCNPIDQRGESGCYPHAMANVETRGEAQFWARNAIDGLLFNDKHGNWPYHSWGIGERRDAWLRIDFGRPVTIDEVALVLRADFPHDAWWERGTLDCSDGFTVDLPLVKTAEAQHFPIGEHTVTWVRLRDLVKANDPSPFPALTQLEVFGFDAE